MQKKISRLARLAAGAIIAYAGTASAQVIYCPAGFYCNEFYDQCIANGMGEELCARERDFCYADACGYGGNP